MVKMGSAGAEEDPQLSTTAWCAWPGYSAFGKTPHCLYRPIFMTENIAAESPVLTFRKPAWNRDSLFYHTSTTLTAQ
jgi:hypothetical protein